ncbi:MAG: DUF3536 domain-containing protein, partial [Elusimicrobia bacterium]|nr:DUF3536 domain-containing protein [Elusimicrobiota bacterium]MBD3412434.1 DUF3536 domain-containing protein [Elusimicrobiota bacterium]
HNIIGGAREYLGEEQFTAMRTAIKEHFMRSETSEVIRLIDQYFTDHRYSLWYLFKDEQRQILEQIFEETNTEIESSFRHLYKNYFSIMQAVNTLRLPVPEYFTMIVEFILNADIKNILTRTEIDFEKLSATMNDAHQWGINLNQQTIKYILARRINGFIDQWKNKTDDTGLLEKLVTLFTLFDSYLTHVNLWKTQNVYFFAGKNLLATQQEKAGNKDPQAQQWVNLFAKLGEFLKVKV